MNNLTISILKNKILLEILNELKLFSKFKIKIYNDLDLYIKNTINSNQIIILFISETNQDNYKELIKNNLPLIQITKSSNIKNILLGNFTEHLNMPFSILDLEKKIISLAARYEFHQSSLINLNGYIINKNERKIKKNNSKIQKRKMKF